MYAVKVLHGYINEKGQRTRNKKNAKIFMNKQYAKAFADRIGGRIKQIEG